MSSVVSYKTQATSQAHSDAKSAVSGYSRGASAYSQRHKDLLAKEHQKDLENLLQKQHMEQERHRKLMLENKNRMKMQKEQLRKELEDKKQKEDEYLRKMKEDKKAAYIKYLKENSKELLQNFKKKEGSNVNQKDEGKDNRKGGQGGDLVGRRMKSTPSEIIVGKSQKGGIGNVKGGQKNVSSACQMPKVVEDKDKADSYEMEEQDNLDALDLEISRSTNNFKKILDQYHKDMERLQQKKAEDQQRDSGIPLQKFYDEQNYQNNQQGPSKLLESLDLGSSLANWSSAKVSKEKENKGKMIENYKNEKEEQEEVEELIEVGNDSFEENEVGKPPKFPSVNRRETKKLEKVNEVSQKQQKSDWYLKYLDNQSQATQSTKVNTSQTPPLESSIKGYGGNLVSQPPVLKNTNPRSLDSIPNYDQTPVSYPINLQAKFAEKKNESIQGGYHQMVRESDEEEVSRNQKPHWADDMKEDDFYKGLSQQVSAAGLPGVVSKNVAEVNTGLKPSYNRTSTVGNISRVSGKESVVSELKQGKKGEKNVLIRKKAPSVTSVARKEIVEKENKINRTNSEVMTKLEGHVKASKQMGSNKNVRKVVNKNVRSPGTKGTRDTDLDVDEFLKDDFQMLNEEERNLQQEIVDLQKNKIAKVREFEKKHCINTQYQSTSQVINKRIDNIPFADKIVQEEDLEESLDRLDMLLAKNRANTAGTNQPQEYQPQTQYQKEPTLFHQVMNEGNQNLLGNHQNSGLYNQGQNYNIYSNPSNQNSYMNNNYPSYAENYTMPGSGYFIGPQKTDYGMDYQIGVVSPEFGARSNQYQGNQFGNQKPNMPIYPVNAESVDMQQGGYSRNPVNLNSGNQQYNQKSYGYEEAGNKKVSESFKETKETKEPSPDFWEGETRKPVQEKSTRYALKKQQQNQYKNKQEKDKRDEMNEEEDKVKIVANPNLKHLLMG